MDRLDKTPVMSNFLPFRKPLRSLTRISLSVLLCDRDTPVGADAGIVAWRGAASFEVAPKSWEKISFFVLFFYVGLWQAWVCREASYQVVLEVDCSASVTVVGVPQSV
jgi:hypothetical protein